MNLGQVGWSARWGFKGASVPDNFYDCGIPWNDPFPFTPDIDAGNSYDSFPVFTIDGGTP